MKIWKRRTLSLMAVLGLALAGPLALAGCQDNDSFGERVKDAGEDFGDKMEETGEEIADEIDDAT
jgi:hypothetical protein